MSCSDIKLPPVTVERPLVLVVAAALIDPEGRVLLAERPANKSMPGLWEFPGGKVDPLETPEHALARELFEELGIRVGVGCLSPITFASHAYEKFHLLMPLYASRLWRGVPESKEGQRLQWVKKTELMSYSMPPADIPLVSALFEYL